MYASPLIRTLQLLTAEELATLQLFVQSPIFNVVRAEETTALFEFLKRYYPDFNAPELHRDYAGKHFFPKAANPVGALQRSMAQLMNIVRHFVTFRYAVLQDTGDADGTALLHEVQQKLSLMRFYSERLPKAPPVASPAAQEKGRKSRKAENYFENLNQQARTDLQECRDFSNFDEYAFSDYLLFQYRVDQEKAFYEQRSGEMEGDKNLLAATEQLDTYYLLTKLEQMCRLVHFNRMWRLFEIGSSEHARYTENLKTTLEIVKSLRSKGFLQQTSLAVYCTLLDFLTQNDAAEAERLSDAIEHYLREDAQSLPLERVQNIRIMMRGFWPGRYRETKDPKFLAKLFSMQMQQLQDLKSDDALPGSHFQNFLFTALKLGKLEWAEQFYEQYKSIIIGVPDTEQVAILLDICRAAILFAQKAYKKAAETLPHYLTYGALDDIYLYAIAATLDTRIQYELDNLDDEYAERMLHATSTRIRREDSLPPHRRTERLRFFPLAKELFKLKLLKRQDRKANLQPALFKMRQKLDAEVVVDWEWIEAKWKELSAL